MGEKKRDSNLGLPAGGEIEEERAGRSSVEGRRWQAANVETMMTLEAQLEQSQTLLRASLGFWGSGFCFLGIRAQNSLSLLHKKSS